MNYFFKRSGRGAAIFCAALFLYAAPTLYAQRAQELTFNSDVLTYFQNEIPYLLSNEKFDVFGDYGDEKKPFLRFLLSGMFYQRTKVGSAWDDKFAYDYSNQIFNVIVAGSLKITNHIRFAFFHAFAKSEALGPTDPGSLIYNGEVLHNGEVFITDQSIYWGSGLIVEGNFGSVGVFGGTGEDTYHHSFDGFLNEGVSRRVSWGDYKDKVYADDIKFKFALVPLINAKKFPVLNVVFDRITSYLGTGAKTEKSNTFLSMLNWTLNLGFKALESRFGFIKLASYITSENYDKEAKYRLYGVQARWNIFGDYDEPNYYPFIFLDGGYREFFEREPYFARQYKDDIFYNIGAGFAMPAGDMTLSVTYDNFGYRWILLFDFKKIGLAANLSWPLDVSQLFATDEFGGKNAFDGNGSVGARLNL
ncbi:MAG: hypothetical protein LBE74_08750 [Treponema sp.]|jgi:hypothetical protein|nr:hypothetical protein [Treponema sp.]